MLPRTWQQQGQTALAEPSRGQPALSARLRLFGLLTVLGPLFAGLHSLVLEAAPPTDAPVMISDAASPTPDVVVVETVVERIVYVPIDTLPVAAPTVPSQQSAVGPIEAQPVASGGPASEVSKDSTQADQEVASAENETEQATAGTTTATRATSPVRVAPPARVAPAELPAEDSEYVAEDEERGPIDGATVADADAAPVADDEQIDADAPRVVVVHTMTWDGEQFSVEADGPAEQYMLEGTREAISELPAGAVVDDQNAMTAPADDASEPADGEAESHQVAEGDELAVAQNVDDGQPEAPTEQLEAQDIEESSPVADAPAGLEPAGQLADAVLQETIHLVVAAEEGRAGEGVPDETVAESAPSDDALPDEALVDVQPEDAELEAQTAGEDGAVVEATEGAGADESVVAGTEATPEVEDVAGGLEPTATPTVGRHPGTGEAADIELPSN